MADPVADKSGFLRTYMSNHPDTLVAYAKWHGKVAEDVTKAQMTAIDSKGMTLRCELHSGANKTVAIPFDPPLSGYDEVKPRLLAMRAEAQQALGMTQTPQITSFRIPPDLLITLCFMSLLIYCTFAPRGTDSLWFRPAEALVTFAGGERSVTYSWIIVFVAHPLESVYTFILCRRHKTPFLVGLAYVLGTIALGYPMWADFRRRVQAARISSIKSH